MKILKYLSIPAGFVLVITFQNCSPAQITRSSLLATSLASSGDTDPMSPVNQNPATANFGTYYKPFAATSPWNSRPVNPVLGTYEVPKSSYFPAISQGAYSTGLFLAKTTDTPMTIDGISSKGLWDPDSGTYHPVTLPRWPAGVLPATGSDGHADILDPVTGVIHSFWQLKNVNGKWVAQQHAWTRVDGTGFGNPAHYFQGARAVGIAASAGIIRSHEIADGNPIYKHALAMSMTFNALSKNPTYIFPATSADWDAASTNYGGIPEGALMMLPPDYDTSKIANLDLRKVADTLKVYGAYVVDRNEGTPYAIYVENGAKWALMPNGWDNTIASQLDQIRAGLRQVISAPEWRDGNEKYMPALNQNFEVLSMRGPWSLTSTGTDIGVFESLAESIVFPVSAKQIVQRNTNGTGLGGGVKWASRIAGTKQRFTVSATGGANLRMDVWVGGSVVYTTGVVNNGEFREFIWPTGGWITLTAGSGLNQPSSVKAELITIP